MSIQVQNLCFGYGERPVLDNVTVAIPDARYVVLLGKNGSGKSTLLKLLSGLLPYKKGEIRINSHELKKIPLMERSRLIGYLPQHYRPVFPFSVEDVVMTGRAGHVTFRPGKKDKAMVQEAMQRVGITQLRKRIFTELSGGQQQLVRIARVLTQSPHTILLDEPTTYLDLFNQSHVLNLLRELVSSGLTVVAVFHDPNMAFVYGDDFIFLKDGKKYGLNNHQKPWDSQVLEDVYDAHLHCVPYKDRALIVPHATG